MRPTYVEVDLDAIAHNVAAFAELIAPSSLCTVVKADAYGHGDVPVASTALRSGAKWLAVALVEEGVRLREAGVDAPILILSQPAPGDVTDIVSWDLEPTVYSVGFIESLAATGVDREVHVKVDTGMHRVGVSPERLGDVMTAIQRASNLSLGSLWTHFAVADDDPDYTRRQIEVFDEVTSSYDAPVTHLANTAGATLFPEARRDMCRVGLGTYGLHPCDETRSRISLRPSMRVLSHVSHVSRLMAGERPSYGRVRPLETDSNVVTVPIGYADGFPRGLTREGSVLIGGRRYPLAGRVTMDQIVVNVGDDVVDLGAEVVLMGTQDEENVSADEWAVALGTISYEVVCSIGPRVPRKYL